MHYLYPIVFVLFVLLILAARLFRDKRYNARLGRVDGIEWRIRSNAYVWEKRAKR